MYEKCLDPGPLCSCLRKPGYKAAVVHVSCPWASDCAIWRMSLECAAWLRMSNHGIDPVSQIDGTVFCLATVPLSRGLLMPYCPL